MAITNNLTEFADNETAQYFTPAQLAESTNITHVGAVLNNRLNYKAYNSLAKMTSKVVVALGDFIVNYSGITTGTIDIDTTVAQWGNFLASIMTDWKLANSVNATTPLNISGTTTNSKTTSGHTHAITTGTVGNGSTAIVNGSAVYNYGNPYFTNTSNIKNGNNGFSAGNGATTTSGGAVGSNASSISGGGAVGSNASATAAGGAVGSNASATAGGAVGYYASAENGFAGGFRAVATGKLSVQLGTGTNPDDKTIQYLSNKVFNADLTKLAPTTANGWTKIDSLTGTPLNLTGKYMFYLTSANGTSVGSYYDTVMNLGIGNKLVFHYETGFARIRVTPTGGIGGDMISDLGGSTTITTLSLMYKKMW